MKVLLLLNISRDLEMVLPDDWIPNKEGEIDINYATQIIETCEEEALELALRMRDMRNAIIDVVTIGDASKDRILKKVLSLNVNSATRIAVDDFEFNAMYVAKIISEFISGKEYDLIVCGRENSISNGVQIGLLLSEMHNIPCIGDVIDYCSEGETIKLTAQEDDKEVSYTVKIPLILTVGNAVNTYLRMTTLRDKIATSKRKIEVIDIKSLHEPVVDNIVLKKISRDISEKECNYIRGENASEMGKALYDKYLEEVIS